MKNILLLLFLSIFFLFPSIPLSALTFEAGYASSMYYFVPGSQEYKDEDGTVISFQPQFNSTGEGNDSHVEMVIGFLGLEYSTHHYAYQLTVPNTATSTGVKYEGGGTMHMERQAAIFHLRQTVGGIFFGAGQTKNTEIITTSVNKYTYEATENFTKAGLEVFFGSSILIRASRTYGQIGSHHFYTNSLGLTLSY